MQSLQFAGTKLWSRPVQCRVSFFLLFLGVGAPNALAQTWPVPSLTPVQQGHVLFVRQWQERDRRSTAGDGLGPMFNARSCAECHNQGGVGGSGSQDSNVELLCLTPTQQVTRIDRKQFVAQAGRVHPAFVVNETTALPTITFHKSSTHPVYDLWRDALVAMIDDKASARSAGWMRLRRFERRTPSLFGAGLIDSIPSTVLQDTARRQAATRRVRGKVPAATGGGVGKFGWRGQTASLQQFVLGACANELGLHVPTAAQPRDPLSLSNTVPGLDLDMQQCEALVAFVASLPAPAERRPASQHEREFWLAGKRIYERAGCALCHPASLGTVAGIYSDLLLHDMGDDLADPAGANVPGISGMTKAFDTTLYYGGMTDVFVAAPPESQRQWRTPPLWGLAESGPYLHDGRARTVDEAIRKHGGEARAARRKYASLRPEKRVQLLSFLYSVGVPEGAARTTAFAP